MVTIGRTEQHFSFLRLVEVGLLALLAAALLFVAVDWTTWVSRGRPLGSVVVARLVVAPLKGNREEYYPDGTETLRCSRSTLPWGGVNACWWVQRRRIVYE